MSSDAAQNLNRYFVRVRGKIHGPFDIEKLKKMHSRGQFSRAHEVSQDKRTWHPAGTLRELFAPSDQSTYQVGDNIFLPVDPGDEGPSEVGNPPDSSKWYYNVGDERHGPVSLMDLRQMVLKGQVTPHDLVWKEGFEDWVPLGNQPEFQMQLEGGIRSPLGGPEMPGTAVRGQLRATSGLAVASVTLGVIGLFPAVCTLFAMIPQTKAMLQASVVLGFVAIFLGISNIFAIIFGAAAITSIGRSNGYLAGWGMALSGLIMGAIGAVGWLSWLLFWFQVLNLLP